MQYINLDRSWEYRKGFADSLGMLSAVSKETVNLPHDGMIGNHVTKDATAQYDSGYFCGETGNYTKYYYVPEEWADEIIGLKFDGVMMHASVEINGCKVGEHHYGYSPFYVDITDFVTFGEENRITINVNTGVQTSSRWYTGAGLFRSVALCHAPRVHIADDGICVHTKEVCDNLAFLEAEIDVCNETNENRMVEVTLQLIDEADGTDAARVQRTIQVNHGCRGTARMAFSMNNPKLWDIDTPNLYKVKVTAKNIGIYKTRVIKNDSDTCDEAERIFGIRTITADAVRGLRINGRTVKLKGGCVHHDNGLLGAVSLYESEVRKVQKLRKIGFNAIRTAHNPPSEALVEACDRVGMYIFDEAFDAWEIAKRPGDFSTHFASCWKKELEAFIRRDRIHPAVIMWSTGNEIPERGGLNNGYVRASEIAETVRRLDGSRPVSNGICSLWSGLDDYLAKDQKVAMNMHTDESLSWDRITEPFTNGLDVVGYNYMEDLYEKSHSLYPDRVILGSENFPKEIGFRWPKVEALPYVIGDFTWTAWDYIGEAGIGKSVFFEPNDPKAESKPWDIMPTSTSPYPWRLANDADIDITGRVRPQGTYRSVVWGDKGTYLYVQHPMNYGKVEVVSMWGFIDVEKCWNYAEYVHKPIELVVFSNADEVAIVVNGKEIARKTVCFERPLPYSVKFETEYVPGTVEAISYKNGAEVSRDKIATTKAPAQIVVSAEKDVLRADGHDLVYVNIDVLDEDNLPVPDKSVTLKATVAGAGTLAALGTANPVTEEVYSDSVTMTYHGHATAVIRSTYEYGRITLTVEAQELGMTKTVELVAE